MKSNFGIIALLLFLFIELITCSNYLLPKPHCNEEEQERIDYIMAKIAIIGPHGRKLPETLGQVKQFCRETKNLIEQVDKFFKECYIRDVRIYANLAVYTFKSQMRKYCGKSGPKMLEKWMKLAPCANEQLLSKDNKCSKQFIAKTKQLITLTNDQDKIRHACCNYVDAYRCARQVLESVPCLRSNLDEMFEMFNSQSSSNLETLCGNYVESTGHCDNLPVLNLPELDPALDRNYVTPVFVLIDLLESMKNYTTPILSSI